MHNSQPTHWHGGYRHNTHWVMTNIAYNNSGRKYIRIDIYDHHDHTPNDPPPTPNHILGMSVSYAGRIHKPISITITIVIMAVGIARRRNSRLLDNNCITYTIIGIITITYTIIGIRIITIVIVIVIYINTINIKIIWISISTVWTISTLVIIIVICNNIIIEHILCNTKIIIIIIITVKIDINYSSIEIGYEWLLYLYYLLSILYL